MDEETWRDLKIDEWSSTLGGQAKRIQTQLANTGALLDHLLRFEPAPEADTVGKPILIQHWNKTLDAIKQHASAAVNDLYDYPSALFSDGEASLRLLCTHCERIVSDIVTIASFQYDKLHAIRDRITEFVAGTMAVIVHAAITNEINNSTPH